jgi:hypothetical protein
MDMNNNDLVITSIEELRKYKEGTVVEFPPFGDGQPFVARITRPSMMSLMKAGKIPNTLLNTANSLFTGSKIADGNDDESLTKVFGVLDVICEACFLEPTYSQLKDNGIELTDDQYMFIFNYTQRGVKALENFRKFSTNTINNSDVKDVQ